MDLPPEIVPVVHERLGAIYEEVMWLAQRPKYTPSDARAWYTHIAHLGVRRNVRRFTGKVSREAATNEATPLRLEHFKRMQTTLTQLVARHLKAGIRDATDFINTVIECEQVHIVTAPQNYAAMKANGDYALAGIELLDWHQLPLERRRVLWKKVLNGKVANAARFKNEA